MPRKRYSQKNSNSLLPWLIVSLLVSALISFSFNLSINAFIRNNNVSFESFLFYFSLIIGILVFTIFVLITFITNKSTQKKHQEFDLINFRTFTDALQKSSSDSEVFQTLQKYVSQIPQVSHATIYYPDDKLSHGGSWEKISNCQIPICNMHHRSCPIMRSRKQCLVQSLDKDIACANQLPEYKCGSYICLPILDSDRVLCILQVYSSREFAFDNLVTEKIMSYIDIAKSSINSKKALNVLNKKASTDKLTKLYNRSFLDPYLDNQIEISNLTGQPLSIIMLDIDHFKNINDTYGHAAGDHVLVIFSEILLKCTRGTDLVARFGGEEFIAVLPSTSIETAASIAERIRHTTANTSIPPLDNIYISKVTCSMGISVYPTHSSNKHDLIRAADSALYKAKESGRNCVKVYSKE